MAFGSDNEQCRLCLSSTTSQKSIFTTEDDNKITLATKIMVCTSLVVTSNDDKPQYLCLHCQETLESFFEFRNKCIHSHFQLCFDSDAITVTSSPPKRMKAYSPLNIPYLEPKQEREEIPDGDYASPDITSPTMQIEQQVHPVMGNVHNKSNTVDEQRMECGNCLNGFYSLEELDEHWNSCGANKNEEWRKEVTNLNPEKLVVNHTDSNVNLHNHVTKDVPGQTNDNYSENKQMQCVDCVKVFKSPKLFTEHLRAHSNGTRYNCRECPKSFIDHYELKYHMRIHSGDDRFKCKECGKIFPRPSSLRRHVLIHSRVKPHQCKYCSKTFAHPYSLPAHERTHTGEMPFQCRFCSKSFYECSAKVKHEKNHVRSNKMFQCDICNRMFATHEEMDEHFNTHDSQMVWKCKTCRREFRKPSGLKTHALRCHDDKVPFECEVCFESFELHSELKTHINVHTGDTSS